MLDGVTLFLRLKDVSNTRKQMQHSISIGRVLQCNGGKLKEGEDFKCVFVVYCVLESKEISSSA